jgi:hypothetical protein
MTRLPTPGGDENTWGNVLNDFLSTSLNTDGSIKASAIANKADLSTLTSHIDNVTTPHGYSEGLFAARPSASGKGFYFATDQNGGTLYRSVSGAWQQAAGATQSVGMRHLGSALAPSGAGVVVGTVTGPGSDAAIGVALPGGGVAVTATTTGLPVQVRASMWLARSGSLLSFGALLVILDGAVISASQYNSVIDLSSNANPLRTSVEIPTLSLAAGSHTFELRVRQSSTAGTISTYGGTNLPGFLSVYEVVS